MAVRGWGGSVATAIGVAAGAGAAQLGLGYGLGIIAWLPSADGASEAAWVASLAWAAWIAATSSIIGAICAQRLTAPDPGAAGADGTGTAPAGGMASILWRVALAVASAIGGLVTVVLVAVPARAATRADTFSPQTIAAGYAVIGVMIGLLVAIWALSSPAVANNVLATVGWLWSLAVIAVVDGVLSGRGLAGAQLGVWQITADSERFWFRNYFYWPGAALSLGSALVIGVLAARSAARRPTARVGAAISGLVGPLLVAAAYFLAAPRLVGIRAEQVSAHLMAPYAVVAGVVGSALVAAIAQRSEATADLARTSGDGDHDMPDPSRTDADPSRTDADPIEMAARPTRSGRRSQAGASSADAGTGRPETGRRRRSDRLPHQGMGGSGGPTGRPGESATPDDDPFTPARVSRSDRSEAAGGTEAPTAGADPAGSGEVPAEAGPKSRLGRFGRRSR